MAIKFILWGSPYLWILEVLRMIIDQDFKKFNNRVNKMLEDKKINEYQYNSLLTMKFIQKHLESIDHSLSDIINRRILK